MPASKMKKAIASVLKEEGFISEFGEEGEGVQKSIKVGLNYYKGKPVIKGLKRVSKPSCRVYAGAQNIPRVRGGMGLVILSTSKGVMSGKKAKKENVGGEVLCYVW